MKTKILIYTVPLVGALTVVGCTNLEEHPYRELIGDNFYQTRQNVIQGFVRPFEHAYWAVTNNTFQVQENSADHFMTIKRDGHWLDNQTYQRIHYHTWDLQDGILDGAWNNNYQGVVYCNSAIADMERLKSDNPLKFEMTEADFDDLIAQLKTLRANLYITLLDMFRNIPLSTKYPEEDLKPIQVPPKDIFDFIEAELLDAMAKLKVKAGSGGNGNQQGQWTKAGAAGLLAKLYLNAELWIGEDHYDECAELCEKIINGDYGSYGISKQWDAAFAWNNETCEEVIYAYTSSYGYARHVYEAQMYWWGAPFKAAPYFGFSQRGDMNHRYGLQPGLDLNGNEYPWENGKPVRKFQKYPDDVRLKKYRNLGNSTREGMFLYGYLDYVDANGETKYVTSDDYNYTLYLRDQVGVFKDTPPEEYYPNPSSGEPTPQSDMYYGDQNSGWCLVKYPHYSDNDHYQESDFVILRLPEIYYSLAECKFRAGDAATASKLLNAVRARYYPEGSASLYNEDGSELSEQELLDEWGREFIGEGMRRTTLCRFGVYSSARWWDKEPDSGDYTMILPFSSRAMQANTNLKQNPGWPDIDR